MAKGKKEADEGIRLIAQNRKARHEYHLLETFEAGLVLTGTEVKALRDGRASLAEAYAVLERGEAWLHGLHISPYEQGNRFNHEPTRVRKLLLHRGELRRLLGKTREKGLALVPLRLYFKDGWAKVEIALGRGKKAFDKRQDLAKRDADRDMERAMRRRR
jgi:SsrA-binding protein